MDNGIYRTRHLRDQTNRRLLETRLVKVAQDATDQLIDAQLLQACGAPTRRPRADVQDFTAFFVVALNINHNQAVRAVKPRADPVIACCYRNPHLFTKQPTRDSINSNERSRSAQQLPICHVEEFHFALVFPDCFAQRRLQEV